MCHSLRAKSAINSARRSSALRGASDPSVATCGLAGELVGMRSIMKALDLQSSITPSLCRLISDFCRLPPPPKHDVIPVRPVRKQFPLLGVVAKLLDLLGTMDLAVGVCRVDDDELGVVGNVRAIVAVVVRPLVVREPGMDEIG